MIAEAWSRAARRVPGADLTLHEAAIDRDRILTDVARYWFTGTAGSSANLFYGSMHSGTWHESPATTPTGVAVFAEDVVIRRYAE